MQVLLRRVSSENYLEGQLVLVLLNGHTSADSQALFPVLKCEHWATEVSIQKPFTDCFLFSGTKLGTEEREMNKINWQKTLTSTEQGLQDNTELWFANGKSITSTSLPLCRERVAYSCLLVLPHCSLLFFFCLHQMKGGQNFLPSGWNSTSS